VPSSKTPVVQHEESSELNSLLLSKQAVGKLPKLNDIQHTFLDEKKCDNVSYSKWFG
jgi:hypothetical protein